eukprot:SAG25_NODE_69_length_17425_cov_289.898476_8_plen_97_part_00
MSENEDSSLLAKFQDVDFALREHCDLVVGWGGALGACPTFDLYGWDNGNYLTVGGRRYWGHCPQGARVAAGATITWDTGGCAGGVHDPGDGWEICF